MNTAMYLRKSRAEELSDTVDETLKRHREILLDFAARSKLNISKIYEEVESGGSLYSRPRMLELLAAVEHGEFDAVLCMDIDRLGRGSMSDQGLILETLKNAGAKIITPRKVYDLNNETDETYSEFESFLARQELKAIKRRMQRGIKKTAEEGGYLANAPFGYRKIRAGKRPTLAVQEDEARFVRMMFDLYVNRGMGCQHIADTVSALGAKPNRAARFGRTSVIKILRNPVYCGKIVWNRSSRVRKGVGEKRRRAVVPNPEEKWIVSDGLHPPLISRELFDRAQVLLAGRYHPPANTGELQNPLAGLLFCAHCGRPMQRQAVRGGGACLLCPTPGCMASASLPLVEQAALDALSGPFSLRLNQHPVPDSVAEGRSPAQSILRSERKTVTGQIERLQDLLEQGVYDAGTYRARRETLQKKLAALEEAERRFAPAQPRAGKAPEPEIRLGELYRSASVRQKNLLLKSLVGKILYRKEKGAKPAEFSLVLYLKPLYPS